MSEPYHDPEILERLFVDDGLTCEEIGKKLGTHHSTIHQWIQKYDIKRPKLYQDPDNLEQLYIQEELSQREIAEKYGVAQITISRWLEKHEIERPEAASYSHHNGYPKWRSQKDVLRVHQLLAIAEGYDPHDVFSDDTVTHHENGIKWANWPENIELMNQGEHVSHHLEERYRNTDKPWEDRQKLWELYVEREKSAKEIGNILGCSQQTVFNHLRKFDIPVRKVGFGGYDHEPHPMRKW